MAQMNLSTKQKQTYREQPCGCQRGEGMRVRRGVHGELGVGRCKLLHLEWINSKILMYGTGNYIQYPVIMEKTIKEELYMYITESLCYIAEIGTTL